MIKIGPLYSYALPDVNNFAVCAIDTKSDRVWSNDQICPSASTIFILAALAAGMSVETMAVMTMNMKLPE